MNKKTVKIPCPWLELERAASDVLDLWPHLGPDYERDLSGFRSHFFEAMRALIMAIMPAGKLLHHIDRMVINPENFDAGYMQQKIKHVVEYHREVFITVTKPKKGRTYLKRANAWLADLHNVYYVAAKMARQEAFELN